eukprot:6911755-Heterocapsa_arctica.AAC.1
MAPGGALSRMAGSMCWCPSSWCRGMVKIGTTTKVCCLAFSAEQITHLGRLRVLWQVHACSRFPFLELVP